MRTSVFSATLMFAIAITFSSPSAANDFRQIIAFGDSLSDPGNAFVLTGELSTPPYEVIPSAAYAIGGAHFSNGRTWVEKLGQALKLQRSTGPSNRNPAAFSNYAVGASRARDGGSPFSASVQVAQFLGDVGGQAPSDALYTFAFGGNDVRDALQAGGDLTIIDAALTAIGGNLVALCDAGAGEIIVANSPNIGIVPAIQDIPNAPAAATALSAGFNLGLAAGLAGLVQPMCPSTTFYVLDLFDTSTAISLAPESFGFEDLAPCLNFGVTGGAVCRNPKLKFFWDGIHPTTAGHAVFAEAALDLLRGP